MAIDWFYLIDGNRRVRSLTDDGEPDRIELFRSDESKYRLHPLKKKGDKLVYADARPAGLKVSVGVIDAAPDSGTFTITDPDAGQTTAAIAYNAPASGVAGSVQTLIRASLTTNFSNAVVTGSDGGPWTVDRGATGAHADITATSDALVPSGSTVNITNTQQGTSSLNEKWQIRLRKASPFLCTSWSAFASLSYSASQVTAGSSTQKEIWSVTWNADTYEGNGYLQVTCAGGDTKTVGPIPYNATASEFQTILEKHSALSAGNKVAVGQNGPGNYTIAFDESFTSNPTITVGDNSFKVPVGDEADIGVATAESDAILGTDTEADVTFEIEVREDSGKPRTIQEPAKLKKDLITSTPGQTTGVDNFVTESELQSGTMTLLLANGSLATPAVSFDSDGWGFYYDGTDDLMVVCDGGEVASFSTGGLKMQNTSIWLVAGNAGSPSIHFGQASSDTDTGFYRVGANQIGITTGGTLRGTWDSTGLLMGASTAVQLVAGSAGTPALNFGGNSADTNTGVYAVAADQIGVSCGGTLRATFNSGGLTMAAGISGPSRTETDTYTATQQDFGIAFNIGTAKTLNLPAAASNNGRVYMVKNKASSSANVTIDPDGAEQIEAAGTYAMGPGTAVIIQCDGTGWNVYATQ